MSDPGSFLDPPAAAVATLQIPEGTFVLTYDKLDPETILRFVQDDTAGAVAAFIRAFTRVIPALRSERQ